MNFPQVQLPMVWNTFAEVKGHWDVYPQAPIPHPLCQLIYYSSISNIDSHFDASSLRKFFVKKPIQNFHGS